MRIRIDAALCALIAFLAAATVSAQQPQQQQQPQTLPPPTQKPAATPPPQTPAPQQTPAPAPRAVVPTRPAPTIPPPAPNAIACTVNGQPIPETAVYRGLKHVPADKQGQARTEILNFLVDNTLIDQYLEQQQKIVVQPAEVDGKIKEIREEVQKRGSTFEQMLQEFDLTEPELRKQIASQLRWDRYAAAQATDEALRKQFDSNRRLFDGTLVRARHILLTPAANDPKAQEAAKGRLTEIKAAVQKKTAETVAKLPPQTDAAEKEKVKAKSTEEAFGEFAVKESACPSKAQGGDLGWFPYSSMVEPFAKTAFALKPFEISDVVPTQFGHHLIVVTEHRAGKEPKFEDVKGEVKEIFVERMREALCAQLRQNAKVVMNNAERGASTAAK